MGPSCRDDPVGLCRQLSRLDGRSCDRRRHDRRCHGLAGDDVPVPGPRHLRVGAAAAACHAHLCHRLYLCGTARFRGSRSIRAARLVRLGAGRLLVCVDPVAWRRHRRFQPRPLPLCLHARARGVHRAVGVRSRGQPHAGRYALAELSTRGPAAGATGHRGRLGIGLDGNAKRFRRRAAFRDRYIHDRDLSRLVRPRRACGRGATRRSAASLRVSSVMDRAGLARPSALSPYVATLSRTAGLSPLWVAPRCRGRRGSTRARRSAGRRTRPRRRWRRSPPPGPPSRSTRPRSRRRATG